MNNYDVIVVGGGFAGVAAAIAASRQGLSVMLAERMNCFGGASVNCLVNPFMPFWTRGGEKRILSAGIFSEIIEELRKVGGYRDEGQCFDEEKLKLVLNRMILKEKVTPLFHSYLTGVTKENGKIKSVILSNKSGNCEYFADCFIDCTGDGDLAVLAGCDYKLGRDKDSLCQPMTLCFRVANVDTEMFWKDRPRLIELYKKYKEEGKISNPREDILVFRNMADGVLHFNSTRIVKLNPTDGSDITTAEIMAREQVFELFDFIKSNSDSFRNASVISTAMQTGVRESRMIIGHYVLTGEDLLSCRKFDDGIAVCNYDIDIHNPEGSGTSHHYFEDGTYYNIPYRCLCPVKTDNLLVAGRCISSDHEAQASYRIMPTVCTLGEAAGVGSAVALKSGKNVIDADVIEIQAILRKNGAIID